MWLFLWFGQLWELFLFVYCCCLVSCMDLFVSSVLFAAVLILLAVGLGVEWVVFCFELRWSILGG